MTMLAPIVHINGTSKDELLSQQRTALEALNNAVLALKAAAPNGRDYYPIGDGAYTVARFQHDARIIRLTDIIREMTEIAKATYAQ